MTYDNPARYELNDPNSDSTGPTASMESNRHGDYVLYSDYCELLEAHGKLADTISQINDLSR